MAVDVAPCLGVDKGQLVGHQTQDGAVLKVQLVDVKRPPTTEETIDGVDLGTCELDSEIKITNEKLCGRTVETYRRDLGQEGAGEPRQRVEVKVVDDGPQSVERAKRQHTQADDAQVLRDELEGNGTHDGLLSFLFCGYFIFELSFIVFPSAVIGAEDDNIVCWALQLLVIMAGFNSG